MPTQRQKVILGVLVVVMAAVYLRGWRPPTHAVPAPEAAPEASPADNAPGAPPVPRQDVSADRAAQRRRAADVTWGRDPFLRGGTEAASGLVLSGILWDAQAPVAILNGQMLHLGEELDGFRVTLITSDAVTVTDGTETFQLHTAP